MLKLNGINFKGPINSIYVNASYILVGKIYINKNPKKISAITFLFSTELN
jgi:hypothetical protein